MRTPKALSIVLCIATSVTLSFACSNEDTPEGGDNATASNGGTSSSGTSSSGDPTSNSGGTAGSDSDTDGNSANTGSGAAGSCLAGNKDCACYGNATCNAGLSCVSDTCVRADGAAGGAGAPANDTTTTTSTSGNATSDSTTSSTSAGGTSSCPEGSERCPCYGNGTCDDGLSCFSDLCVDAGSTGGGSSCAADTENDPDNCGVCGYECIAASIAAENPDHLCPDEKCCQAGTCAPALHRCLDEDDGFSTCSEYCGSIGEACVNGGCGLDGITFLGWGGETACQALDGWNRRYTVDGCDEVQDWDPLSGEFIRCCCTDTQGGI